MKDAEGNFLTEELEIWYRDPVECVKELLGNPMFREVLTYEPLRSWLDEGGTKEVVGEMSSARWWWELQVSVSNTKDGSSAHTEINYKSRLPVGATVAPIILSSDKTKLSNFRGDKSAWPLYLTIGNLSKEVRRMPSAHSTILIGYLPVGNFECFSDKKRKVMRYQTFHSCMSIILKSLQAAGNNGVPMACADNKVRRVWPVVAAYVADYPEQCLVACCMENRCPIGQIAPDLRGSHQPCLPRSKEETLRLLEAHASGALDPIDENLFKSLGIRPVHQPFWMDLPHNDTFRMFTPDLLHQLHKGVFKDHLVKWCTTLVSDEAIDARFKTMPGLTGLRHFKNGISGVSQWTGHEHKEMERVFVGLIASEAPARVVEAVRALLDFIYLASLHRHTSDSLRAMDKALDDFHRNKEAFIEFEARHPAHFNIPKYHMMEHYVQLIRLFGTADGFNTEWSERLHIDYAKEAYRASNKKDYTIQMTTWLRRQESVDRFAMYLYWCRNSRPGTSVSEEGRIEPGSGDYFLSKNQARRLTERVSKEESTRTYHVPAKHPPRLRAVPASQIIIEHHALQFLPAVRKFLRSHECYLEPRTFDDFHLFNKISLELPCIPEVSRNKWRDCVRATPPSPASGRRKPEAAHLDFALVQTGETNTHTDGTSLEGE